MVLCLSQDGACTESSENFRDKSLKGDLSNDVTLNPPLLSLENTFKHFGVYSASDEIHSTYAQCAMKFVPRMLTCSSHACVPYEEGRAVSTVKVLIKNLAIFFLCPSKQFLPVSFNIQLLEYFPQNRRNNDKSSQDAYKLFNLTRKF